MLAPVIVRDLDVDDTAKWPQRSTTSATRYGPLTSAIPPTQARCMLQGDLQNAAVLCRRQAEPQPVNS